ncbi:MAG TPA: hypothetical protein VNK91_10365 [Burkholderiaceae bacterium]|nr:hypothetical protein [Burkholderiaceae bacterium]
MLMEDPNDHSVDEALALTHTGVFIHRRDHVIVPTIVDAYADDKRHHALVYHWLDGDWSQHLVEDSICGVVATGDSPVEVLNVGVNGTVVVAKIPGGESTESVDPTARGPNYSETLRCVRKIGPSIYVAGMARQVYRRDGLGRWVAVDAGTYLARGQRHQAVGFLDIDGDSDGRLYAVGYKGEIWIREADAWTQEPSPTSVALTKVLGTSSGDVVICGLAGVILRGTKGRWQVLAEDATREDFWGLAEYLGEIYLATDRRLFKLVGNTLQPVDFGSPRPLSTSYLHSADGVLWSVGPKDIVFTDNGTDWHLVPNP